MLVRYSDLVKLSERTEVARRKKHYLLALYEVHVFVNTPDGCISLYEAKLAGYTEPIKKGETTLMEMDIPCELL